ncbi:hypothetical protein [Ruminococcus sp. XPD3002]|uniref:hypothetical protein n=1 Tax=Ruminococcus sp. XPD3002 TaxID=1452269 RepID=UPI001114F5E6
MADKKDKQRFPAVIAHFMYNESQGAVMSLLAQDNIPENASLPLWTDVVRYIPILILAVIFMILLLKNKKKEIKT